MAKVKTTIRPATLDDVEGMALVTAAGFMDDDVFGNFQHPHRREHPNDWHFWWVKEIRTHLVSPTNCCFVTTLDEGDDAGRIVGLIIWERMGEGAAKLPDPVSLKAQRAVVTAQNLYAERTWTDQSADTKNIELFDGNWDDVKHHWTGPRAETWYIHFLCVHPDFWFKGLAQPMIQKGIDLAKAEDPPVSASVICSELGEPFYRKWGFEEVGSAVVGPLKDLKGGSIKFYEKHLRTEG